MLVRPEKTDDYDGVRRVNVEAFDGTEEATIVDELRKSVSRLLSLVAVGERGEIVGHILFSPVTIESDPRLDAMGLGPMAVAPEVQRRGIGTALVEAGLEQCRTLGVSAVVVLGHPEYYPRFGFVPASRFGLKCEFDVPDEVFMATELSADALQPYSGLVRYHRLFGAS